MQSAGEAKMAFEVGAGGAEEIENGFGLRRHKAPTIPLKLIHYSRKVFPRSLEVTFHDRHQSYLARTVRCYYADAAGAFAANRRRNSQWRRVPEGAPESSAGSQVPIAPAGLPPNNLNQLHAGIESLLRAGNLYLSLQDAIALALENNLDIAIQRYAPLIGRSAAAQAEAGGFARGVSTNVTARTRQRVGVQRRHHAGDQRQSATPRPATRLPARSAAASSSPAVPRSRTWIRC